MVVLGIDPGTARMGWGVVDKNNGNPKYLECGCIETSKNNTAEQRLEKLYNRIVKLIDCFEPDALAVEELYFAQNVKTAFAVGQAKGIVLLAAAQEKIPVYEYTPLQIKQALTGYGRASKRQIQVMVVRELGLDKTPTPDDAADGLAVALTHCYTKKYAR